jgi:hypothetical protein
LARSPNGCTFRSLVFFCSYVNGLIERYPEIFEGGGSATQHQINFGKKWGNYQTLIELADGEFGRIDWATEQPLEKCLLYLSFKSDETTLKNLLHREALKKQQQGV